MPDVELRDVEPTRVALLRKQGSVHETGKAFQELYGLLMQAQAPLAQAPPLGVFYGEAEAFDPDHATYEVCAPLAGDFEPTGQVEVRELPAAHMAVAVHKGPYETIGPLYTEMFAWLKKNGCRLDGPVREVYLVAPGPGGASKPEDYVTEVQMPVQKA